MKYVVQPKKRYYAYCKQFGLIWLETDIKFDIGKWIEMKEVAFIIKRIKGIHLYARLLIIGYQQMLKKTNLESTDTQQVIQDIADHWSNDVMAKVDQRYTIDMFQCCSYKTLLCDTYPYGFETYNSFDQQRENEIVSTECMHYEWEELAIGSKWLFLYDIKLKPNHTMFTDLYGLVQRKQYELLQHYNSTYFIKKYIARECITIFGKVDFEDNIRNKSMGIKKNSYQIFDIYTDLTQYFIKQVNTLEHVQCSNYKAQLFNTRYSDKQEYVYYERIWDDGELVIT